MEFLAEVQKAIMLHEKNFVSGKHCHCVWIWKIFMLSNSLSNILKQIKWHGYSLSYVSDIHVIIAVFNVIAL